MGILNRRADDERGRGGTSGGVRGRSDSSELSCPSYPFGKVPSLISS